jgi:hypothetical protein
MSRASASAAPHSLNIDNNGKTIAGEPFRHRSTNAARVAGHDRNFQVLSVIFPLISTTELGWGLDRQFSVLPEIPA